MEMRGEQDRFEDDIDGPPPGWEFCVLSQALTSKPQSELTLDTGGHISLFLFYCV